MRGALQIVFSDLGTPKPGEWNVYEELSGEMRSTTDGVLITLDAPDIPLHRRALREVRT